VPDDPVPPGVHPLLRPTAPGRDVGLLPHRSGRRVEVERLNAFRSDPRLADTQNPACDDYFKSGFDRGHLVPRSDMNRTKVARSRSCAASSPTVLREGTNAPRERCEGCRDWTGDVAGGARFRRRGGTDLKVAWSIQAADVVVTALAMGRACKSELPANDVSPWLIPATIRSPHGPTRAPHLASLLSPAHRGPPVCSLRSSSDSGIHGSTDMLCVDGLAAPTVLFLSVAAQLGAGC
jgi:hypothetical protein